MAGIENEVVLRLSHRFAAPPERVFDAWTNPEVLRQWWSAGADWSTPSAEVDLRPGGRYRLSMQEPEGGAVHTVVGEYTDVERPTRLAYTWEWEDMPPELKDPEPTLVTVEFSEDGDGTEVVLTHTGFGSADSRGQHEHGWQAVLANLERALT